MRELQAEEVDRYVEPRIHVREKKNGFSTPS